MMEEKGGEGNGIPSWSLFWYFLKSSEDLEILENFLKTHKYPSILT